MKAIQFILAFLLVSSNCQAQHSIIDSLKTAFTLKPKLVLGFHNRNLLVNTLPVKLYGAMIGLQYGPDVLVFAGVYGFDRGSQTTISNHPDYPGDPVVRTTSVSNLSAGIEYTFFRYRRFSLSAPVQLGFGAMLTDYFKDNILVERQDLALIPLEGGISGYYSIFKWFGIKGGLGYRFCLGKSQVRKLSSPYYNIGLSIMVGVLYGQVRDHWNINVPRTPAQ